jgi:hypothetical protein
MIQATLARVLGEAAPTVAAVGAGEADISNA